MKIELYDHPVCDFCSGVPSWRYPAQTFTEFEDSPLPQQSIGDWLACNECAALIQRNEWEKLARRGLLSPMAQVAISLGGEEAALAEVRRLQKGFRRHRSGRVRCEEKA